VILMLTDERWAGDDTWAEVLDPFLHDLAEKGSRTEVPVWQIELNQFAARYLCRPSGFCPSFVHGVCKTQEAGVWAQQRCPGQLSVIGVWSDDKGSHNDQLLGRAS
jgi:hypothetical protein